jgi:hypothetical protein
MAKTLSHYKKRIKELERAVGRSQRLVTSLTCERAALLQRGRGAWLALRHVAELLELAALLEQQQRRKEEEEEQQEQGEAAAQQERHDGRAAAADASAARSPQRMRAARAAAGRAAPLARFRQQLLALQADLHEIVTPEQEGCEEVSNSASGGASSGAAASSSGDCQMSDATGTVGAACGGSGYAAWWRLPLGWSARAAAARAPGMAAAGELSTAGVRGTLLSYAGQAALLLP